MGSLTDFYESFGKTASPVTTSTSPSIDWSTPSLVTGGSVLGTNTVNNSGVGAAPTGAPSGTSTNDTSNNNNNNNNNISVPKPDMNAINDTYNPIMDYLSGEESRISGQMPSVLQSAQESFDNSKNTLNTGFEQGNTQLGQQGISAEQAKINEQNEQRQLYNELTMGGNQRFGGASSASEAYRALLGQEQQRVGATTSQQYQTAKREIETAKFNLQQDYTNQIASLEQQNRDTQNAIRMEFDDRLSQIRSMRAESESAKANAKLGALQQYKAEMYNLSMANMQYKQELQSQAQAASSQISNAEAQWNQMMQDGQNSVNTFNEQTAGQPTTKLTFGASGGGSSGSFTPVGQITSGKKDEDNIFTSMFGGGNAGGGAG